MVPCNSASRVELERVRSHVDPTLEVGIVEIVASCLCCMVAACSRSELCRNFEGGAPLRSGAREARRYL